MNNKLTKDEIEFLVFQLVARKDYFEEEMKNGIKTVNRLNEVVNAINALQKGIDYLFEMRS